jgi:hypothetical protein
MQREIAWLVGLLILKKIEALAARERPARPECFASICGGADGFGDERAI